MILPVFVGVHTASALFFVPFVFNPVYLFCPCYFYCLFLCNFCMAMLLNLQMYDPSSCCLGIRLSIFLWPI
jgi:hypothetical protein